MSCLGVRWSRMNRPRRSPPCCANGVAKAQAQRGRNECSHRRHGRCVDAIQGRLPAEALEYAPNGPRRLRAPAERADPSNRSPPAPFTIRCRSPQITPVTTFVGDRHLVITALHECADYFLRIVNVHLAAECFNVEGLHYPLIIKGR